MLAEAMRRLQAQERLRDPDYCGRLTMNRFRDLLIEAGCPLEEAREAALRHGWDRISAGMEA